MLWTPEPLFAGSTAFIIGGGPSLRDFEFSRLRGRKCIAVNAAGNDVPWADVLFFKAPDWPGCISLIDGWKGFVVTVSDAELPDNVKRVEVKRPHMPRARTSGQYAVSLAVMMKASRVVLLGFDWNREGGNYHSRYGRSGISYRDVPPHSWEGYRERAMKAGCEVLNATPGSLIAEFRKVDVSEVM